MMKIIGDFTQSFWKRSTAVPSHLEPSVENHGYEFSSLKEEEKRLATRVSVDAEVWYRTGGGFSSWQLTKSKDYSSTGVRLVLLFPVAPGTAIDMKIKLAEMEQPLQMQGTIVWVAQTTHRHAHNRIIECGVAFKNVQQRSQKDKLVYLLADKFCHLGIQATRHLSALPAQNIGELKACYEIVYKGYLSRGYCLPSESKMFYHYFSFLPKSRTFTLKENGKIIGTISVVVDSPCGLPMDKLFSKEMNSLRRQGRKLAEVTLLALDSGKKKSLFSLANLEKQARLFRLFKIMYEYAHNEAGVTDLIIGVHPKHASLYKYLQFRPLASIKQYSGACGNLALPLHLQIAGLAEKYSTAMRSFFTSDATSIDTLRGGLVLDAKTVAHFLTENQLMWPQIPERSQEYFFECYPELLNDHQISQSDDFDIRKT